MILNSKLFKVKLYGLLGDDYTRETIEIYANTVQEVFSGLQSRFGESFKDTILNGGWHITTGSRRTEILSKEDTFLSEEEVTLPIEVEELHVFPAVVGAGVVGRVILGILLIIVAVVLFWVGGPALLGPAIGNLVGSGLSTTVVAIGLLGVSLLAGGISQLLSQNPEVDEFGDPDDKNSLIYNGPVNNTEQGVPIPLIYGFHQTGSTVISATITTEQLLGPSSPYNFNGVPIALPTVFNPYDPNYVPPLP